MYLKSITWFLLNIVINDVQSVANPVVDTTGLGWALFADMLFQFTFSLQDFLTWILIIFYAVLFWNGCIRNQIAFTGPTENAVQKHYSKNYEERT